MRTLFDAIALARSAVYIFAADHSSEFFQTFAIALVLAALCWLTASNYSRLWNLRFQTTKGHHILCLFAAVCTLIFAVLFSSLQYTKDAADRFIDSWSARLITNLDWAQRTHKGCYEEVKKSNREDPVRLLQLWEPGRTVSLSNPESQKVCAETWANETVADFDATHLFLSKIVRASSSDLAKSIAEDMTEFFRTNPSIPIRRVVDTTSKTMKRDLLGQTDSVVWVAKAVLFLLFLVVQLVPFSLIGYAAYKDLKITT